MLFSQGISTAEELAGRIVLLFQLCEEQLSSQSHYDFGLRALKSVLVGAGGLKRKALQEAATSGAKKGEEGQAAGLGGDPAVLGPVERDVLIRFVYFVIYFVAQFKNDVISAALHTVVLFIVVAGVSGK